MPATANLYRRATALLPAWSAERLALLPDFAENFQMMHRLSQAFRPELVVSDFESFAYLYSVRHGLPCISIDNQQIISRCRHDDAILEGHAVDFQATKAFVKLKLPGCAHYIITTFFYPDIKPKYAGNTTLEPDVIHVPPPLRQLNETPSGASGRRH